MIALRGEVLAPLNRGITKEKALEIAKSFIQRHDMNEYIASVETSSIYGRGEAKSKTQILRRAQYCYKNTDWEGVEMDFEDLKSAIIRDGENGNDYWEVYLHITPVGGGHIDGNATPISMRINKKTGEVSNFWAEVAF